MTRERVYTFTSQDGQNILVILLLLIGKNFLITEYYFSDEKAMR